MSTRAKGKRVFVVSGVILLAVLMLTAWFSWGHLRFWWLFESMGSTEQGYPEYRHRETGIVMVRVPGGTALIGYDEACFTQTPFRSTNAGFTLPTSAARGFSSPVALCELRRSRWND